MPRKNRRNRKASYQRARRLFLESLEDRRLLASAPVAIDDPWYTTPINTDLVVTGSGTTLLANDSDSESLALTSSIVANPSNGTIVSSETNGTFTYRPTNGYTGLDSFTYKINNGTFDSAVATVSIAVGGVFGPRTNLDDQPLDSPLYTGAVPLAITLAA